VTDVLTTSVAVSVDAQGLVALAQGLVEVLLRGGPRVPVPELPRIAALAGSEAAARARKLETLIVTSAYRFNRLSFRPLTTAAMCPTGQQARRIWPADVGQPPPIFSQQTRRGNERTKKTKG
jgi:hypothetical protein